MARKRQSSTDTTLSEPPPKTAKTSTSLRNRFAEHASSSSSSNSIENASAAAFDSVTNKGRAAKVSTTGYGYTWLRFRRWLVATKDYSQYILDVDIENGDPHNIFKSIKIPLEIDVIKEYMMTLRDGSKLAKTSRLIDGLPSESTPRAFTNALSHVYKIHYKMRMSK
jgi:hypothetical protein